MLEVCGKDCCCEAGISIFCVAMICRVVVTIATCGVVPAVGRHRLAMLCYRVLSCNYRGHPCRYLFLLPSLEKEK